MERSEPPLPPAKWAATPAAGVEECVIAQQTSHRSMSVLRRYIRGGELFRQNAT
jgi:hypothetical protein